MKRSIAIGLARAAAAALLVAQSAGCASIGDLQGTLTTCQVHHTEMETDVVPYGPDWFTATEVWGVPKAKTAEYVRMMAQFPHSERYIPAGCWDEERVDSYRVRYCQVCRDAEAAWVASVGGKISEDWAVWRPFPIKQWRFTQYHPPGEDGLVCGNAEFTPAR